MNEFSIILPVRNGGEHIKECVNSILAQTYPNFELIILDNCSSDGTVDWLKQLNNSKISIKTSSNDLTIVESWQRIVSIPKKQYCTLIGHDDILFPNFLEEINDLINQNKEASLFQTHFSFINSNGEAFKQCKQMKPTYTGETFLESLLLNAVDIIGTGFVMKSSDYDQLGGIPNYPNLLFADAELWHRLTALNKMVISHKTCFSFRVHQSATANSNNEILLGAFTRFIGYLLELKKQPIYNKCIEENGLLFLEYYCKALCHRLIKTSPNRRQRGESVAHTIAVFKGFAKELIPNKSFKPKFKISILTALIIDSNTIFRKIFLWYKRK